MNVRLSRQIPVFGEDGQTKISEAKVAIVGLGGLGCNVITQLASAGVGKFIIVDSKFPEENNLNRQFIYAYFGLNDKKTVLSEKWIKGISKTTSVDAKNLIVTAENVADVLKGCDLVVDCTDNNETRLILNKFCLQNNKPLVHGGTESMFGQVYVMIPGKTACLECFMKNGGKKDVPSVGAAVSMIAAIQSGEVLKLVTGKGEVLAGKMLTADQMTNSYRVLDIPRDANCPACKNL